MIVLVTTAALWPLCTAEFTSWDDSITVCKNPTLNPPTLQSLKVWWTTANLDLWDPVTDMVRGALALVGTTESPDPITGSRLNPYVFHTANLLLHIATALIVYRILLLLLNADTDVGHDRSSSAAAEQWAACGGAILFAIHPLQVESVGWVTAMKDLLCGLFSLAATWRYLVYAGAGADSHAPALGSREPKEKKTWRARKTFTPQPPRLTQFWIATILFLMATLSKPTAVVVPAMILVISRLVLRRPLRQIWRGMFLWCVLALPCIIVTKFVQPAVAVGSVSLWQRPLIGADALAFYLWKIAWPVRLGLDYGRTPQRLFEKGWIWCTWIAPVTVAGAIWIARRQLSLVMAGAMIFVIGLLPVLGLVPFDFQSYSTVSDHYLYLSMFGVALAASWVLLRIRSRLPVAGVGVVLALLSVRAWNQTRTWQSSETLYLHAMKINPESFAAAEGLAVVYVTLQRSDDAIHYARESIRLHPNQSEPWYTLGEALNQEGRVAEAANAFYVRYRLNSESPWAADDLARVLAEQHLDREAIYYFRRACALDPKFARSHRPLALLLAKTGRLEEAIQQFRSALLVDANDADLHLELAGALAKSGQIQEARRECLAALQIKPDLAPARDLLSSLSK